MLTVLYSILGAILGILLGFSGPFVASKIFYEGNDGAGLVALCFITIPLGALLGILSPWLFK